MPLHPELPPRRVLDSRRTPIASGPPPSRNPRQHGTTLGNQLTQLRQLKRVTGGVDPDLVFKIQAANTRIADEALIPRGLSPLGETSEYLYFVLAEDDGTRLGQALTNYSRGEDRDGAKGPLYTLFDRIDAIEPYGPDDRRGPGLNDLDRSSTVIVDVSIWPSSSWAEAQRRADIVAAVVESVSGELLYSAIGVQRSVLRVRVSELGLDSLLETSVVELVRSPPEPFIDASDWRDIDAVDLQLVKLPGVAIGMLDDEPASGHPLLSGLISSVTNVGPEGYNWPAPGHHGSQVASRILLPRLAQQLRDHDPVTSTGTLHVARVLEPTPGQDGTRFAGGGEGLPPHEVVRRAITGLFKEHGVRIFNLSFGLREPFNSVHVSELTEVIDDLVRQLDVVIVVPTGNAPVFARSETDSGHHAQRDYPLYLSDPAHRLSEPGPAALALTVGSYAHSDAPAERTGMPRLRELAIARVGELSPFSRTGPGVGPSSGRINKPDSLLRAATGSMTATSTTFRRKILESR